MESERSRIARCYAPLYTWTVTGLMSSRFFKFAIGFIVLLQSFGAAVHPLAHLLLDGTQGVYLSSTSDPSDSHGVADGKGSCLQCLAYFNASSAIRPSLTALPVLADAENTVAPAFIRKRAVFHLGNSPRAPPAFA